MSRVLNQVSRVSAGIQRKETLAIVGLAFIAGYFWRSYVARSRLFEVPGSRSTIPDEMGHYDMDGVSFDDDCGVVVSSDARTPAQVSETKTARPRKWGKRASTGHSETITS